MELAEKARLSRVYTAPQGGIHHPASLVGTGQVTDPVTDPVPSLFGSQFCCLASQCQSIPGLSGQHGVSQHPPGETHSFLRTTAMHIGRNTHTSKTCGEEGVAVRIQVSPLFLSINPCSSPGHPASSGYSLEINSAAFHLGTCPQDLTFSLLGHCVTVSSETEEGSLLIFFFIPTILV